MTCPDCDCKGNLSNVTNSKVFNSHPGVLSKKVDILVWFNDVNSIEYYPADLYLCDKCKKLIAVQK